MRNNLPRSTKSTLGILSRRVFGSSAFIISVMKEKEKLSKKRKSKYNNSKTHQFKFAHLRKWFKDNNYEIVEFDSYNQPCLRCILIFLNFLYFLLTIKNVIATNPSFLFYLVNFTSLFVLILDIIIASKSSKATVLDVFFSRFIIFGLIIFAVVITIMSLNLKLNNGIVASFIAIGSVVLKLARTTIK